MIYLAHADGTLPNLALMRLGTYFRMHGETVRLLRPSDQRTLFDPPGRVFGSSIFRFSAKTRERLDREWGPITWGGTGVAVESSLEQIDADADWDRIRADYSLYPDFTASIGFLTRGCRLRCGFCVVPTKEGRPRVASSVRELWRGEPYPRHLHLLDNDAFAPQLASHWQDAVREIREGDFRVCFSQGINIRLVTEESAAAIASITYTDASFSLKSRTLYTAWDSLGDEAIFRRGIDAFVRAGIPSSRLTVYMLVGYDPRETWEAIFYRYTELRALGCDPYPMVFDREARPDLCAFQRWALGDTHGKVPWPEYTPGGRRERRLSPDAIAESDAAWMKVDGGWKPQRRQLAVTDADGRS